MKRELVKKSRSFTLIEIIVAVAIFMVVVTIALATLTTMTKTHSNTDIQGTTQKESRFALAMMANEVKAADVRDYDSVNFYYGFAIVNNSGIAIPTTPASGYRLKVAHYDSTNMKNITRVFDLYNVGTNSSVASCTSTDDCYIRVHNSLTNQWSRVTSPDINVLSLNFSGVHHVGFYYNTILPFLTISMTTESKLAEASGKKEKISLQTTVAGAKDSNIKSGLFTWIGPQNGNIYKVEPGLNFQLGDTIYTYQWPPLPYVGGWPTHDGDPPSAISDKSYLTSGSQYFYAAILTSTIPQPQRMSLGKFDSYSARSVLERPDINQGPAAGRPQGLITVGNNLYLWLSDGNLYLMNSSDNLANFGTFIGGAIGSPWPSGSPDPVSYMTSDGTSIYQTVRSGTDTMIRKVNPSGGATLATITVTGVNPRGLAHLNQSLYLWKSNGTIASLNDTTLAVTNASVLNFTNPAGSPQTYWSSASLNVNSYLVSDGRYLYLATYVSGSTIFSRYDPTLSSGNLKYNTYYLNPLLDPSRTIGRPQGLTVIQRKEF